ncbi:MAG: hypothetical protein B6D57_00705 [Candidatus Coatesbacteria bacterium 4484_99]|uniref:bis(5'-nucleosyl)-tetraphosphatase (symmetrical) n=1 Tax=Candidatus Coatesbacteria bacterium 4484_99 TaxID=1970774 RepID=A0A1W9S2W3_9BACT|nr:MAG: hypothetical protein B6D57_00705 [Candidatus Coatesbacteria bacterium 4484_99]RLC41013.1 MAG: hypothetical protein DRH51_04155 [Candidatus Coatesbacteria bacterium]
MVDLNVESSMTRWDIDRIINSFPVSEVLRRHMYGTARLAKELSLRFSENPQKAYIAGCLHDICRGMSDADSREYVDINGIQVLEMEYKSGTPLLHPIVAHHFLREKQIVDDERILEAVRYHTTGRPGMCNLTKLVMVADILEDSRDGDFEEMRSILDLNNIDDMVREVLRFKVDYIMSIGLKIHPLMSDTLKKLEKGVILSGG